MLNDCCRDVKQATLNRREHKNHPLYQYRRALLTWVNYLSDVNKKQLARLFSDEHTLRMQRPFNILINPPKIYVFVCHNTCPIIFNSIFIRIIFNIIN